MNLGIAIISITALGYISNWLNWRFLNYKLVQWLYYLGTLVHETSHALLCLLTGAKIKEFSVFSSEPHVTHLEPKIPLVGKPLISLAPIFGGLSFLYVMNHYLLANYFTIPSFSGFHTVLPEIASFLAQINLLQWQSWVMLLVFMNLGAMLGPSPSDLKNIWPFLLLFFLFTIPFGTNLISLAILLILTNILLQIALIFIIKILKIIGSVVRL